MNQSGGEGPSKDFQVEATKLDTGGPGSVFHMVVQEEVLESGNLAEEYEEGLELTRVEARLEMVEIPSGRAGAGAFSSAWHGVAPLMG